MWPHPKPGAVSAVDVTASPEHSLCSCTISGPPADAQSLLDKLGDKLQSIFIDSVDQPDPSPSKKKPRGYKLRASRLSNLYSRLARLRRRLAHVSNKASILEAKSDWRIILNTSPVIDNLRLSPPGWDRGCDLAQNSGPQVCAGPGDSRGKRSAETLPLHQAEDQ